jgi:hypothetical protein
MEAHEDAGRLLSGSQTAGQMAARECVIIERFRRTQTVKYPRCIQRTWRGCWEDVSYAAPDGYRLGAGPGLLSSVA